MDHSLFQKRLSKIKVIGFDLDDTLWNNKPVIVKAINAQFDYLIHQLPNCSKEAVVSCYQNAVAELIEQNAILYEDLSLLRLKSLEIVCEELKADRRLAQQAFDAFYRARQEVTLFPFAKELLTALNNRFKLIAISNGNVELMAMPIGHYFSLHWRGGVEGRAKPHADLLHKACDHFAIAMNEFLYVGDTIQPDYLTTKNAGCSFVLIPSSDDMDVPQDDNVFAFQSLADFYDAIKKPR